MIWSCRPDEYSAAGRRGRRTGGAAAHGPPGLLGKTTEVARALPDRQLRMIGAWCFLDHYGPEDVSGAPGMQVWAHPHTGLQTVSWLLEGEIEHRDSLGSQAMVRPGELQHHDRRARHRAQRALPAGQAADAARRAAVGRAARRSARLANRCSRLTPTCRI